MKAGGQCRVCGCTETQPCAIFAIGLTCDWRVTFHQTNCAWADQRQTLCTNPGCLEHASKQRKRKR